MDVGNPDNATVRVRPVVRYGSQRCYAMIGPDHPDTQAQCSAVRNNHPIASAGDGYSRRIAGRIDLDRLGQWRTELIKVTDHEDSVRSGTNPNDYESAPRRGDCKSTVVRLEETRVELRPQNRRRTAERLKDSDLDAGRIFHEDVSPTSDVRHPRRVLPPNLEQRADARAVRSEELRFNGFRDVKIVASTPRDHEISRFVRGNLREQFGFPRISGRRADEKVIADRLELLCKSITTSGRDNHHDEGQRPGEFHEWEQRLPSAGYLSRVQLGWSAQGGLSHRFSEEA